MKTKKILFICKYNRFRSRVAEAYFKMINKNKSIKVASAGIVKGNPLDKKQIKIAKKFGININGKPQGISTKLLQWQDMIIVVADDVSTSLFKNNKKYGKQLIIWKIPDKNTSIKQIMEKTKKLSNQLNKTNEARK